ncbi:prolyl oligopeptidase family serine peptidase [Ideonella azotifigens]|uniref:Prolyl oligopeptidase family serine peptidase n=1 Tax=Ideonella azotifigens TaxID=513160 RepID=A0ABP3UPY9_9BURK|nr:prolyl oligopeptidase family serine peptidase [Ideonella azotifigens]MCD2343545.1 prolyl oligopeptidase family serine peptidase [Ideonella azotifigens]
MSHFNRRQALALLGAAGTPLAMAQNPISAAAAAVAPTAVATEDPYLWLEDVLGDKALNWVREHNAASRSVLEAQPDFEATRTRLKDILDSRDRIPLVSREGEYLYNLWKDHAHPRGLWRRTTLDSYRQAEPQWDVILDLDALAKAENENWVWSRATRLGGKSTRALVALSRGGADATVVREFDLATRRFVDGGFTLPEAKSDVAWLDENTLFVGTDFGPGSLTDSGYPRVVKLWKRGEPLSAARTVYEAQKTDVAASISVDHTPGFERVVFGRAPDFFTDELVLWHDGKSTPVAKPADAQISFWRDALLIKLRSDWAVGGSTWASGSLLMAPAEAYLRGERQFTALFTPTATRSLEGWSTTRSQVLLDVLDNVANRVVAWRKVANEKGGEWQQRELKTPFPGALQVQPLHDPQVADDPLAEHFFVSYVDFLTPDSLYLGRADQDQLERIKARPAFFDTAGMRVEQRFAKSKDGTRVPYFVVWPQGAIANGKNPTLLYGYGGFEVSMQPWYSASWGHGWLRKGGVLVVANIRGGGEFGPAWHQAAIKSHKQKSYDDFIAVAEDLLANNITTRQQLGIQGGSNGGLLVGAVMMQRPDLFNAMVCQVPLLDMKRFNKLLAGASWMGEYGNPDDPAEWSFISKYSPYQNVHQKTHYPRVFFVTSTRDDRVHPGHARKMAARMMAQGHPVLYYENIEGGHGGAADNAQLADRQALEFAYLWAQLGSPAKAGTGS